MKTSILTLLTALLLAPLAAMHAADSPIDRHSLIVYDDFGDAQAEKPAFHSSGAMWSAVGEGTAVLRQIDGALQIGPAAGDGVRVSLPVTSAASPLTVEFKLPRVPKMPPVRSRFVCSMRRPIRALMFRPTPRRFTADLGGGGTRDSVFAPFRLVNRAPSSRACRAAWPTTRPSTRCASAWIRRRPTTK